MKFLGYVNMIYKKYGKIGDVMLGGPFNYVHSLPYLHLQKS